MPVRNPPSWSQPRTAPPTILRKTTEGLTAHDKQKLVIIAGVVLIGGYYSPVSTRTVAVVALTGAAGAAVSRYGDWRVDKHLPELNTYQRVLAWGGIGAAVGIGIDALLRPKLDPERI